MAGPPERHQKRHRESVSFPEESDRKVKRKPSSSETIMAYSEQKLKTFTERDDTLRSIATCKICFRMLYEPYTLGCGHTYCYSCLDHWFRDGERKKPTCPDCRTVVSRPPAPAYLLREMVREILRHGTLLPDGETVGEHMANEREEADLVDLDKTNTDLQTGGLFKGRFRQVRALQRPLHDAEDGVMRCPHCTWELEDDGEACAHCGYNIFGDSEDDSWREDGPLSDEEDHDGDLDEDMDLDDAEFDETFLGPLHHGYSEAAGGPHHTHSLAEQYGRGEDSHNEDEYNSDEDSSMDGFVADDDEEVDNGSDSGSSTSTARAEHRIREANLQHRRQRRRVIDDDDGDDDDDDDATIDYDDGDDHDQHGRSIVSHEPTNNEDSSEENSSLDEQDYHDPNESRQSSPDENESNDNDSMQSGTSQTDGPTESSSSSESEDDDVRPSSRRIFHRRANFNRQQAGARFTHRGYNIRRPRTQTVR